MLLLVSSKKITIYMHGTSAPPPPPPPPIHKTLLNGFAKNLRRGLNSSGGSGPPIPPVATPLNGDDELMMTNACFKVPIYTFQTQQKLEQEIVKQK